MTPRSLFRLLTRRTLKSRRTAPAARPFRLELSVLEDRANPAQLWVAAPGAVTILNDLGPTGLSAGDTVRVALPGGQFTSGTFGTNVFSTVESAVTAANGNADASNTIRVGDGTFTITAPQLAVTKNLNLVGLGRNTTTIQAGTGTSTGGATPNADTSAKLVVNRGVSLNVGSLTLDGGSGSGVDVPVLLKYTSAGSGGPATSVLSDVAIQNVGTNGGGIGAAGTGVYVSNGNVTVTGSALQNIGTNAVLFNGASATGAVLGSTLTGQGAGTHINVGVGVNDSGAVTVRGNTLSGFLGSSGITDSAAVSIQGTALSNAPAVDVESNQLTNNRIGVTIGPLMLTPSTVVSNNNIVNSTVAGVSSLTGGVLTGLQNYYSGNLLDVTPLLNAGNVLNVLQPVTSTPPAGPVSGANGTVSGRVTNTTTGTGVAGATVYVDANGNGQLDPTEVAVKTDANGNFTLSGIVVPSGSTTAVQVRLVVPPGATAGTTVANVNLSSAQPAASGVNLTLTTTKPANRTGGTPVGGVPGASAGTPRGPGAPADGSTLPLSAVGGGTGFSPEVVVYNPDGSIRFDFNAFDPSFQGGVTVATGDINRDGVEDIIVGAGFGADPHVVVFDGATGALLRSFDAFDPAFKGGITVSVGDINRDGIADIIVGAAAGLSPHVKVFSGKDGSELMSFFAFDAGFKGGVNVAAGDVNGDGFDDVIVGAAAGANPHVKAFSGKDGSVLASFLAFAPEFRGGVTVAAGDVDSDGKVEIAVGAGFGGEPRVSVFSGTGTMLGSFLAYDPGFRGGVRVGYELAPDGSPAIVTGAGVGGGSDVRYFDATGYRYQNGFFALPSNANGVNVS